MQRLLLSLMALAIGLISVGCGSSSSDDFDPNKIAVKQPGSGPPPMTPPMSEGGAAGK